MAIYSLNPSSDPGNNQTPGQKAAQTKAAKNTAIQGLGAGISVLPPVINNKEKVQLDLLTSISVSNNQLLALTTSQLEITKELLTEIKTTNQVQSVIASHTESSLGILNEIKTVIDEWVYTSNTEKKETDKKNRVLLLKIHKPQFEEILKHQETQQDKLNKALPAFKTFAKIINFILDKRFEKNTAAFLSGAEIIYLGFHKIAQGINEIKPKPLIQLAGAIAILGLSIFAFGLIVTAPAAIKTILVLAGFSLILRFLYSKENTFGIAKAAIGVGLLGLAIWAFGELVNYSTMLPVIIALTGLAGALFLFKTIAGGKDTSISLILAAAGLGVLALSLWAFKLVSAEQAIIAVLAVSGLALALKLFTPESLVGAAALGVGAIALGIFGLAFRLIPDNLGEKILPTLGFIVGYGLALAAAGAVAPFIIGGAVAMGIAGAALLILAGGIALINAIDIKQEKVDAFSNALLSVGKTFAELGGPIDTPMILLGASAGIAIGAAALISGGALALISGLNIDLQRLQIYASALNTLSEVYYKIGGPIDTPMILLGAGTVVTMSAATVIAAGALGVVSYFNPLKSTAVDAYKYALTKLSDTYVAVGGPIRTPKIALGVIAALMMSTATLSFAKALHQIDEYQITQSKAEQAAIIVDSFVSSLADSIDRNAPKIKAAKEGFAAISGLGNLLTSLADGIGKMANLNYVKYEVRDNKLVPVQVVRLTDADLANVGIGVGKMINSLTLPLELIGSAQESTTIFGLKVTNPNSNKVRKGIEALTGIGNILLPIAETIKIYADKGIDRASAEGFGRILAIVLNGVGTSVETLVNRKFFEKPEEVKTIFTSLQNFLKSVADVNAENLEKFNNNFNDFYSKLTDEKTYAAAAKNLDGIRVKLSSVKSEFNGFDLQKLTIFNELTKNLASLQSNNKLLELIKELGKVAESISEMNGLLEAKLGVGNTNNYYTNYSNGFAPTPFVQKPSTQPVPSKNDEEDLRIVMADYSKTITDALDKINSTLRSPLSFNPANPEIWRTIINR